MRQRLPLWFLALGLLWAGAFWLWKRSEARQNGSLAQISNGSQPAGKTIPLSFSQAERVTLLSRPTPVDFTEALAKAHEKQYRSRWPNRLSNTPLPLKQLAARESAILLQNA